ncbi:hypothetical protein JAAARDRAFT_66222 [Jaapia argillacea MUCL 33604]|uniref:Telomere-associated protein Rif1 N-terminal domain-containing protein n=1 Tax=Jaapia argillacea MUCL 33604 TaxID=933084 RepID=A0A067QIT3_9AGAM|nr:hypothetical protein JAAARDRAFT_66222 [Jaapia argillacea MUCL 33604]
MKESVFQSPINTLVESEASGMRVISHHDLCEAYDTLSAHLRLAATELAEVNSAPLFLNPLQIYLPQLTRCLVRDIKRILYIDSDPIASHSDESVPSDLQEVPAHSLELALDSALVCHSGLRFLSNIFRMKPLFAIFNPKDLGDLLQALVKIGEAEELPSPHFQRTYALLVWILRTQRLPGTILLPHIVGVCNVLKSSLDQKFGLDVLVDASKTICNLLQNHTATVLPHFAPLLPQILSHLISSNIPLRHQAAATLGAFALVLVHHPPSSALLPSGLQDSISHQVASFIKAQSNQARKRKAKPGDGGKPGYLPNILNSAIARDSGEPGKGPQWAISVLASLTVLSDYHLFSHPSTLKMVMNCVALAKVHPRVGVNALHAHVWRYFIWSFSRMPADDDDATRDRALLVVKQDLGNGIGIAIVTALLPLRTLPHGDSGNTHLLTTGDPTHSALVIVEELLRHESRATFYDGIAVLTRLLSGVGAVEELPKASTPAKGSPVCIDFALLDGRILDAKWDTLKALVSRLRSIVTESLRTLSEVEMVEHWERLFQLWTLAVKRCLQDREASLPRQLAHSWQSLLLTQAQLTQGRGHLTTPPSFAENITSFFVDYLASSLTDPAPEQQCSLLSIVYKLWSVMQNVYSASWISTAAGPILSTLLQRELSISDHKVKDAWSKLCSSLLLAGSPNLLDSLSTQTDEGAEVLLKKSLWSVLARTWDGFAKSITWEGAVALIVIPVHGGLDMSESELRSWEAMIRHAISTAKGVSIRSTQVIEAIIGRFGNDSFKRLRSLPEILLILLQHINLADADVVPTATFTLLGSVLSDAYPPRPERLRSFLDLLQELRDIISSIPPALLQPILLILTDGLGKWIRDEANLILEQEYNNTIIPIYCQALRILQSCPPCLEDLHQLAPFLAAAFVRVPPPALGPCSFKTFWEATYSPLNISRDRCPVLLKPCLGALFDAYGGDFPTGWSDSVSVLVDSFVVSDSQPSKEDISHVSAHDADISRYPHESKSGPSDHIQGAPVFQTPTPPAPCSNRGHDFARNDDTISLQPIQGHRQSPSNAVPPDSPSLGALPLGTRKIEEMPLVLSDASFQSDRDYVRGHLESKRRRVDWTSEHGHLTASARSIESPSNRSLKATSSPAGGRLSAQTRFEGTILPSTIYRPRSQSDTPTRLLSPVTQRRSASTPLDQSARLDPDRSVSLGEHDMRLSTSLERSRFRSSSNRSTSSEPDEEEYASWEIGMVSSDFGGDPESSACGDVPESQFSESLGKNLKSTRSSPARMTISLLPVSPGTGASSLETGTRSTSLEGKRSQTAPAISSAEPRFLPPPLRRAHTTSRNLEALHRVYETVADDASQLPVDDLLQAQRLVNQMGHLLNEQMAKRLGGDMR